MDKKNKDRSYFAVERGRRKKVIKIIIPVIVVVAIAIVAMSFMSGPSLPSNKMALHNHVNLTVTSNGQPITVPAHIGMVQVGKAEDQSLYGDHSLDKNGMEGMSPLHTHDTSGSIHVESNTVRDYTLGELLDIWRGLSINGKTVQATLNGNPVSDFRNIILKDGYSIDLDIS